MAILPLENWIALAVYYAIIIPYFSYIPIWDGLDYLENYLFNPDNQWKFEDYLYSGNGHPSFGYYWPFFIGLRFFPDNVHAVQVVNLLIGSLAIIAFGRLAAHAFRGSANRLEVALLTVAFAVSPVVVAYTVNMTMDSGVVAYFVATLWLLYARRSGWAVVTGLMLVFCKEAGILFYTLIVIAHLAASGNWRRPVKSWPIAIPFAGFAAYLLYRRWKHKAFSPWAETFFHGNAPWQMYIPNPFSREIPRAGIGPFLLEFQWVFTAFILIALVAGLFAHRAAPGFRGWLEKFNLPLRTFFFLIVGVFYVVSRTVPFINQRYFLPLYPLILLCFFAALLQLRIPAAIRTAFLAGMTVLLVFCNFWTLDPLSKKVTGVFLFGDHPMLGIDTMGNPNASNIDVLVYNLQHTQFGYLLDEAFAGIKPTSETVFVVDTNAWRLYERIDAATYRRTERHGSGTISLSHLKPEELFALRYRPADIYLIELPTFHNARNEAALAPYYQVTRRLFFSRLGYSISVVEMARRTGDLAAKLPSRRARLTANIHHALGAAPL